MKSLLLAIVTLAFAGSVVANEPATAPAPAGTETATTATKTEKKDTKTADAKPVKKSLKKKH